MNKLRDKLSIASFSENAVKLAKKYKIALEINHSCISENLDEENVENTLKAIRKDMEASERKAFILHAPFTEIVPASIDKRAVDLGLDRLNEAYELCMKLNINKMVVHSGCIPLIYHRAWHKEKSIYFWKTFMKDKSQDFTIYIENVFDDEPYLLCEIIDELDEKRIKLCLDIGHCNVHSDKAFDVASWIDVLGHRIGHVHLHNNFSKTDQHLCVCEGDMDIDMIVEKLLELDDKEEITFTIESRSAEESIRKMLTY